MSTELRADVELPESWAAIADETLRGEAARAIGAALDAVLADFGVPAISAVNVKYVAADAREHAAEPVPQVRLGNSILRCSPELAARVQAATLQQPLRTGHFSTPGWLLEPNPNEEARQRTLHYVVALCAEIVKQHPADLLTQPALEAIAQDLSTHGAKIGGDGLPALDWILRHLLQQRIGIGDRAGIAEHWRTGCAERKDALQIAESLADAAGISQVAITASRATLRTLTMDMGPSDPTAAQMFNAAYFELGVRFPSLRLVADDRVPEGAFSFNIGALATPVTFGLRANEWLAPSESDDMVNDPSTLLHPRTLAPLWLRSAEKETRPADAIGPLQYLFACLDTTLRELAPCFMSRSLVERELESPATIGAAAKRVFRMRHTVEALTQVLRRLVAERVFIRNFRHIVESLCDFDYVVTDSAELVVFDERLPLPAPPDSGWLADPQTLTAFVRIGLKRQIMYSTLRGGTDFGVFLLEKEVEQALAAVSRPDASHGGDGRLARHFERALLRGLREQVTWSAGTRAPILLTTVDARTPLRKVLADVWPMATVLAYQELIAGINIHALGRIRFVF